MPEASVATAEPKSVAEAIAPTADPLKPRSASRTGNSTLTKPSPKPRRVRAERMMPVSGVDPSGSRKRRALANHDRDLESMNAFNLAAFRTRLTLSIANGMLADRGHVRRAYSRHY